MFSFLRSEENKINLKTDIVQLAWYKHSYRGLVVYVEDGWIPEKLLLRCFIKQ